MYVSRLTLAGLVCGIALLVILVGTTTILLITERTRQEIRLYTNGHELLTVVQHAQGACDCVVNAVPLNGEEDDLNTRWRVSWDDSNNT